MYHQDALSASGTTDCYVPVPKDRSLLFAEISLDVRSIFPSFVTWKCLKYWNIFMASKSVYVKHVADISENHRWECHCDVKEQHLILSKASVPEVCLPYPFSVFFANFCSFHTENLIWSWAGTKNWKPIGYGNPDAYFVQLGQIENGVNEGAVPCNAKTAFSFTPSSIVT